VLEVVHGVERPLERLGFFSQVQAAGTGLDLRRCQTQAVVERDHPSNVATLSVEVSGLVANLVACDGGEPRREGLSARPPEFVDVLESVEKRFLKDVPGLDVSPQIGSETQSDECQELLAALREERLERCLRALPCAP